MGKVRKYGEGENVWEILNYSHNSVEVDKLHLSFLRLLFHDVDPGAECSNCWKLFDEAHAAEVVDFIRQLHEAPQPASLIVHCKAGISRSAAIALYAEAVTGCAFPRRPFSGLANKHLLDTLAKVSGIGITRPKALPKRERFEVSIYRDFETGRVTVTAENLRNHAQVQLQGPMLAVLAHRQTFSHAGRWRALSFRPAKVTR